MGQATGDIIIVVLAVLGCLLGVALTALRLPGTWLIILEALAFGWWTGWERMGLVHLAFLFALALVGEGAELLTSVFTARRVGAGRRAAWGGVVGGFAGMFFLSFLVPIPIVGSMVGALVGCFCGALLAELSERRELVHGTRVGVFSALGFALGTAAKTALALLMAAILLTTVVCNRVEPAPTTPEVTVPSVAES